MGVQGTRDLATMLKELEMRRKEYLELVHAKRGRMIVAPPAPARSIAARETALGLKFPASYRTFLSIHNGWLGLWGGWSVLGTGGPLTQRMERDIKKRLKLFDDAIGHGAAAYQNLDPDEAIARERKKDLKSKKASYAPNHPVIGTDFNGGLLVFDRRRQTNDGEFGLTTFYYNESAATYKNFTDFIARALKDTISDVAEAREES